MCEHNIGITGVSIGNNVPARADAYYDPRNKSECFQGKRVAILDDDTATAPPALVIYHAAATLSPHKVFVFVVFIFQSTSSTQM